MAQHGGGTAGQDGGHQPTWPPERGVPDGVDPQVHPMEPSRRKPPVYCSPSHAQLQELPASYNAVLAPGQAGDRAVTWVLWTTYMGVNRTHGPSISAGHARHNARV
jgi:hypothetical protein